MVRFDTTRFNKKPEKTKRSVSATLTPYYVMIPNLLSFTNDHFTEHKRLL